MTTFLDIGHQSPFGLLFINYSLLLGVAGGLAIIWVFINWNLRSKSNILPIALALTLTFGGILNVLAEVKQPGRLIYGFIYGWDHWYGSVIKYGILVIPVFCLLLIVQLLPFVFPVVIDKIIKSLLVLAGIFLGMYSGIFMANEHGVALWNTPMSAVLMLFSGIYAGFLTYRITARHDSRMITSIASYSGLGMMLITLALLLMLSWWGHVFAGNTVKESFSLLDDNYSLSQWVIVSSLIISCAMIVFWPSENKIYHSFVLFFSIISAWGVRYLLLIGGQGTSRSGAGVYTFHPDTHEYYYSVGSIFFMFGILSLLILLYQNFIHKYPMQAEGV